MNRAGLHSRWYHLQAKIKFDERIFNDRVIKKAMADGWNQMSQKKKKKKKEQG